MKKTLLFISLLILSVLSTQATRPKYVFYIIGDGMGINQVNGTEMFYGELTGKIGPLPLLFSKFPYTTFVSTYSANRGVTDSAAAGTALACGEKTNNNTIGVDADSLPIYSIAVAAQKKNIPVGIITSGEIDDATPAAFFAHQINRSNRYEIGVDMLTAGFDFYAGDKFTQPSPEGKKSLYDMIPKANYTLALGIQEYNRQSQAATKMILFPEKDFPYAIDREPGDICLADLTRCAIDFLQQKGNGFFLMIEGSKIDWAGHSRDGATNFREIKDLEESVKLAYDFYRKYPDETLIIVTADHETGGIVLGKGPYTLNLQALKSQKVSESGYTKIVNELRKKYKNQVPWEVIKQSLKDNFGFWDSIQLNEKQEASLKKVYDESFSGKEIDLTQSEYQQDEPLAAEAKRILDDIALVGWTSGGHSGGYVPVFAIGAGAQLFQGRIDNTEIPVKIAEAAGYPNN